MDTDEGKAPDEKVLFARLMKKLTAQVSMPDQGGRKVIRPDMGEKSIVEVTEELLRQLRK